MPTPDSLVEDISDNPIRQERQIKGNHAFIALCRLTNLLGEVLPLIYTLRNRSPDVMRHHRRLETALDEWEVTLPSWLSLSSPDLERGAPGALNLCLCYLAIRLCTSRVALQVSFST